MKLIKSVPVIALFISTNTLSAYDQEDFQITDYIRTYPAIKQKEMRDQWLSKYKQGQWQITGAVTAADKTVVTPQADVNYGYSWFNISEKPVVISLPKYKHYYSLSVFDMNHKMQVKIKPTIPTVVRLANQKSPIRGKYNDIVIDTVWGLALTRQQLVGNEKEVAKLSKKISIKGGGGNKEFITPEFSADVMEEGNEIIKNYGMKNVKTARKLFCSPYEGCGALDIAAGVFLGQLGTQAYTVDYQQYVVDQEGDGLKGDKSYQIVFPSANYGLKKNGYWSVTVYNLKDRYLIENSKNTYVVSSTRAKKNKDGSVTVNINPNGEGINAIPTAGNDFYAVARFYEPIPNTDFPKIMKIKNSKAH